MAKKRKVNPQRKPATLADVNKAKKTATNEAMTNCFALVFMALRDKEGWGKKRLYRLWEEVIEMADSVNKKRITIDDLVVTLADEAGIYLDFESVGAGNGG